MKRMLSLLPVLLATVAKAEVVAYEADVFPEEASPPWERVGTFDADRWLEGDWLFQFLELGVWEPPPGGEQDYYRRSLTDFVGTGPFFIEWRVETEAPASELGNIPAVLSAFGNGPYYHFTITDELVRLIRHTTLPIIHVDIELGQPHTYHLTLNGDAWYAWYVDGQLVDSGVPQGPYPSSNPRLIWGADYHLTEHTTRWDYVRYGVTPQDASGDFDSDDEVDDFDFFYFAECVDRSAAGEPAFPSCAWADMNTDTDVDCADWYAFKNAWTDPADPPEFSACAGQVPTVSEWALGVMTLLLLAAGAIVLRRRAAVPGV